MILSPVSPPDHPRQHQDGAAAPSVGRTTGTRAARRPVAPWVVGDRMTRVIATLAGPQKARSAATQPGARARLVLPLRPTAAIAVPARLAASPNVTTPPSLMSVDGTHMPGAHTLHPGPDLP